ncbi:metallophosphoesterase (plasmid) [Lysinibacillus capsici]|uniref:metallophosphoesterase family protein n=1 Tax=Lysinibacillus capsici TaxID=2115968 RepID=UPI0021D859EA|nr:metallophosphoesterase [Lysinibacillus capsici]UYB50109.1 metallophosphoesterase [Lysinibacillus capsici]
MKIDYISDLHLDFHVSMQSISQEAKTFEFLSKLLPEELGDILIIAGDLSHDNQQSYWILNFFSTVYEQVLFVLGNHDYYLLPGEQQLKFAQDSKERETDLLTRVKALPNVMYLSCFETFKYGGVTFAGATSWYPLQTERERRLFYNSMNDSRLIKGMDIAATHLVEMQAFEQLKPVDVLITHVPPTKINSHDYFGSTDCFLNKLPSSAAKVFIFGHSHEQQTYEKDDAIYCINALGYPREGLAQKICSVTVIA